MKVYRSSFKKIAIIVLAAGASRRFGQDKLLTVVAGKRLIDWSVEAALASQVGPVFVVTNPNRRLEGLDPTVSCIVNSAWQEGLSASIRCGLQALSSTNCKAAIFTPADQPLLTPKVFLRLRDKFHQKASPLIVASYHNQPRNPVLLARELWETASRIQGDSGLSMIARSNTALLIDCGDIASVMDVDQPSDLLAIEAMLSI